MGIKTANRMKQELKKDEFIEKILHDLKTPVVAQIKALELFLPGAKERLSSDEVDLIELTLNSCKYMNDLIGIFDAVERLNYERLKLHYEKFDFIELINSCLGDIQILFKYYNLNIKLDCDEQIIVKADKILMKKVASSMLSVFLNYAFRNSVISLFAKENKKNLIFELKIPSPKIPIDIINELFEKNKTRTSYFSKAGVGLSLYLSKEIIHAHHGNMSVNSFSHDINMFGFCIPAE